MISNVILKNPKYFFSQLNANELYPLFKGENMMLHAFIPSHDKNR